MTFPQTIFKRPINWFWLDEPHGATAPLDAFILKSGINWLEVRKARPTFKSLKVIGQNMGHSTLIPPIVAWEVVQVVGANLKLKSIDALVWQLVGRLVHN